MQLGKNPYYSTIAGFCLVSIGLCLCRYAYAPMVPAMIAEGWIDKGGAAYLGAFNALGYLVGTIAAILLPGRWPLRDILRASIIVAFVSVVMAAWNFGFAWLALARTLTGLAGASLVVHAPSLALAPVPDCWKKPAGGAIFAGAGMTILLVSLAMPGFLAQSVGAGWLFEAFLGLVAGAVAWPLTATASKPRNSLERRPPLDPQPRKALFMLGAAYFLAAVGITPHTMFLTDYLHRDLSMTAASSVHYYGLIGVGTSCGALAAGAAARMFGTPPSLSVNYLLGAVAVTAVLLGDNPLIISFSVVAIGFFLLACVTLSSQRTAEIAGLPNHAYYWGLMTLAFSAGLTIGNYGLAWLIDRGGSYRATFEVAAACLGAGFFISLALQRAAGGTDADKTR